MDDDDRASVASSENDQDELMEDVDEVEADLDPDGELEEEDNDENDEDNDEDDDENTDESPGRSQIRRPGGTQDTDSSFDGPNLQGPTSNPNPGLVRTSASPAQGSLPLAISRLNIKVREEALKAAAYDIVPTIAAPQSTSINAVAATPDMRFVYSGGSDGYIREFNWTDTVNARTLLTVAQRHPFVDSVTKAGVLTSYWENEEPIIKGPGDEPSLSPVYSLAVHHQSLWLLSGLESGAINLQSVRHEKGKRITFLKKHTSAVSVLNLAPDERSVLSGSWDKNIFDWDLNTGQVTRSFEGIGGQISAIEIRPASSLPVPEELGVEIANGTFSSNNADKPLTNGISANGINGGMNGTVAEGGEDPSGSPADSLFGGDADSLFGDNDGGGGAPSGGNFSGDEDDEFSRAMEMNIGHQDASNSQADLEMTDGDNAQTLGVDDEPPPAVQPVESQTSAPNGITAPASLANGLPHSEEIVQPSQPEIQDAVATTGSTFLAASIDGTLQIWDRRQAKAVAHIPNTRHGVPPWCMGACWSPDGNYIYAGRRNGTVEEFSLHKGLRAPERTFKFQQGSGAVSAVRAMPNGRHLICASHDILRLYDLKEPPSSRSTVPFLIVPGPPKAGVISALHIDPACKYMISIAGNRGWEGSSTEVLLGYEIGVMR